jgi:shikimate dehydrogenase
MESVYGLIGYPLGHSFSKKYFSEKFRRENITNARYELFPLGNIAQLPDLIATQPGLRGLNVTIPYKEAVIPFLNNIDPAAAKIGAVNCISINKDGSMKGYNTDVYGFRQSIKPFLESQHERALILGTGGASKAVYHVLKEIGIDCYFVTRDKNKVPFTNVFEYAELNEYIMNAFKLIVNCSPVGTFPETSEAPDIPYQHLGNSHLLYDLVYNPPETLFMKKGKEMGAATINGLSMLEQQAEEAWRIWSIG